MAQVYVNNFTVTSLHSKGFGFFGYEGWKNRDGKDVKKYWTVFPGDELSDAIADNAEVIQVGTVLNIRGLLTTRVSENNSDFVDHTVNNAEIVEGRKTTAKKATPPARGGGSRGGSRAKGDDAPF